MSNNKRVDELENAIGIKAESGEPIPYIYVYRDADGRLYDHETGQPVGEIVDDSQPVFKRR